MFENESSPEAISLQLVGEFFDKASDPTTKEHKEMQDWFKEQEQKKIKAEEEATKLHLYIQQNYSDFEDYINDLSIKYQEAIEQATKEGKYIENIKEQWTLCKVASMYGRELTEDELEKVDNMFIGTAYYYKGYIFAIMHGQGSCPWYIEWDKNVHGPEQLELF